MPTYVYRCWHCGAVVEKMHSMKEDPVVYCSQCASRGEDGSVQRVMKRVIQPAGIVKKGGGWTPKFYG